MKLVYLSPSIRKEMQEIKREIVLSMNGIVAESLEKQGLNYKRNYGVVVSRLCEIARKHTANAPLAEALWLSGEREFMLLACMLQPKEEYSIDDAKKWLKNVSNAELAEQLSFRLLSRVSFANEVVSYAFQQEDMWQKLVALYILPRIVHQLDIASSQAYLHEILPLLDADSMVLMQAAINVLQHLCEQHTGLTEYCSQHVTISRHPERRKYVEDILESFI